MKHILHIFTLVFCLAFVYSFLTSSSGGRATMDNFGNTGAPTESATCTSCHGGGNFGTISPSIEIFQQGTLIPITAYTAGTTYDMRVTVQHSAGNPAGYGFQMTALTQTNNTPIAGYNNLAANVQQKTLTSGTWAGRTYVEHNAGLPSNVFNFSWTAPVTIGMGTIDFYAAGNAINHDNNTTGDNGGNSSISLPEILPLGVTATVSPVLCNGGNNGAINLTVSGGTGGYSYNWGGGITTEDRTGLIAGTYTVIITDNSGTSITSNYTVTQPNPLLANATNTPILCNGDSSTISVSGSGGTPPYTGTGFFTQATGIYLYIITDANGCTSAPFTLNVSQPPLLQANASVSSPITCHGGSATVNVSAIGGTPPYTSTGNVSLTAGSHNFTVIDANGCSANTTLVVTEPPFLTANAVLTSPILCNGGAGTITVSANGGTPPYSNTGTISVNAGTGSFSVSDANGCSTSTPSITINEPSVIAATVVNINHNTGGNNGSIDVSVNGGTPPYTYSWSNGATTQDISQLAAGLYTLTITDANGCIQTMTDLAVLFQVGIENKINEIVTIYPNPVTDKLYLNFEKMPVNPCFISLYDTEGRAIYQSKLTSETVQSIEVSHFSTGAYFLLLENEGKIYRFNWTKK